MRPWWWRWCALARPPGARGGGAGASGGPCRVCQDVATIAGEAGDRLPHHDAQGRVGGRCRAGRSSHRRCRAHARPPAAACADRVARCRAPGVRHRRASARAVAQLWPDGLLCRPMAVPSRPTACRRPASSATRWWCAPSSRSPPPAMPTARCPRTAWSRSSATRRPCGRAAAPRASWLHAHVEHPPRADTAHPGGLCAHTGEIETGYKIIAGCRSRLTGLPSVLAGSCMTGPATAYFWQVLERAHQTGRPLPNDVRGWF
jgi:hypothetical protein